MILEEKDLKDTAIFCDFDGTVTISDSLGVLFEQFAVAKWLEIEKKWRKGEIGSKECLEKQLQCIKNITIEQFDNFTDSIKIDKYFKSFTDFAKTSGIDFYIVSDGFSLIIDKILRKNKIFDVNIISNGLVFDKNRLIPNFPHENKKCKVKNGNCKCEALVKYGEGKKRIYIGDGFSDVCAISKADLIFAKDDLAEFCTNEKIEYISYKDFGEIFNVLSEREKYANC